MKLVEILARELSEWPDECEAITQSVADTEIYKTRLNRPSDLVGAVNGSTYLSSRHCDPDSHPAVTREMWEAERLQIGIDAANAGKTTPLAEIKAKYSLNPITKRDRIRAIDVQLADLTLERAERIAELAAEGFALLPVVGVADMSDWRNWQAGDLIEFVGGGSAHKDEPFTACRLYIVDFILPESFNMIRVASDDEGNKNGWRAEYFKFHSRPKPC